MSPDAIKKAISVKYPKFNVNEENPYQEEMNKLIDISLSEANTTRTMKNISECLSKSIRSKYGVKDKEELKEKVEQILAIHGLSQKHFDPLSTISTLTFGNLQTVNDISVDDNANKTSTNMEGICGEAFLPYKKLVGYDYLYQVIKELYGKAEAKKCMASMFDFSLALNDSTKILMPYCYCIDASKLVMEGRNFGQVHSSKAKRVSTYVSVLGDTIREISFNIAGACCHKSTDLVTQENNKLYIKNIKELVEAESLPYTYSNYQGEWEYANISDKNIYVHEFGKFVKINKIMRRKYNDDIYVIKTKSGKTIKCSKDHVFKVLYKGRDLEIKASDLKLYDTVYNSMLVKQFDIDKESDDYKRGQFIGIICGDGNIINKYDIRIVINKAQEYIGEFIIKYVKDYYNLECKRIDDHRKSDCTYTLRINSVDVYNDIKKDILGNTALDKHILVRDKSFDYLSGFVDGMSVTDGASNKSIGFGCISKELIQNLYDIAKFFNIPTSEIKTRLDKRPNRHTIYQLNVSLKMFNYLDLMQKKILSTKRSATKRVNDFAYFGPSAFLHSAGHGNKCQSYKERECKLHSPNTDVIVEISTFKNDDDYVYEIETESHWYSINGILTHNCAIGTFFLDIAHLAIYGERITLDELRTDKKRRKYVFNCLQQFIHTVNHYSRNSVESPFTNVSCFDRDKLRGLIDEDNYAWYFPKKASIVEDNELVDTKDAFREFVLDYIEELQEMYIDMFNAGDPLRNGLQFPFPVTTVNLGIDVNKETSERKLSSPDNALLNYITKKDISRFNIYCSEGTKVASCCRLISDAEMLELGEGVNSFGGSQVSLGSHRVVTINFARVAYEAESYDDFKAIVTERVEEMTKILKAHRVLIHKLEKCGTQPWITNGWINMSHMFSTYGCVGYVEADEILKAKFNHVDFDYMKDFLVYFNEECKKAAGKENIIWNIEAIPAEGMAPKLAKSDKILVNGEYDIYANQWCSLWKDYTIYEKMKRDGEINALMTGGSIVHINIDSHVTTTQAKKLISDAIEYGMAHFALNACYVECKECGHVHKGKVEECPNCQSRKLDHYSRIIGYFSKVEGWNKVRREKDWVNRKFIQKEQLMEQLGK